MYSVSLNGEFIGYTTNKSKLQNRINEYLENGEKNVAFIDVQNLPEYSLCLLKKENASNDDEIFEKIVNSGTTYYEYYAILDEDEEKYYYVYRNRCAASYDDQTKFAEAKELTFSVYYLNDTDESGAHLENIVEGTFKANLNDKGDVLTAKEILELDGLMTGYNKKFYQDSYNEFVKPKLIKTAIISFVIAGLVTALFAAVWLLNPEELHANNKKVKKSKK